MKEGGLVVVMSIEMVGSGDLELGGVASTSTRSR